MANLAKNKLIDCWCVGLWQFTSIGVSAIVLSIYYLWGNIDDSFHPPTIIYYFNMLNFPLNALSWNVAGLRNSIKAISEIKAIIKKEKSSQYSIMEIEATPISFINKR